MNKFVIVSIFLVILSIGAVSAAEEFNMTDEVSQSYDEVDDVSLAIEEDEVEEDVISSADTEDDVSLAIEEDEVEEDVALSASNEENDKLQGPSMESYLRFYDNIIVESYGSDVLDIRGIYDSYNLGNLSIFIDGEKVYDKKVSSYQYIYTTDFSKLPDYGMRNVTFTYSGGYYDAFNITRQVNFTYPFYLHIYPGMSLTNYTMDFFLPDHARGVISFKINNKTYDNINLKEGRIISLSIDEFNLGHNEIVAYYEGDDIHPPSYLHMPFYSNPLFKLPNYRIFDDDEEYVSVYVQKNESGVLVLLEDVTDYNSYPYDIQRVYIGSARVENGTAAIKMPKIDGGEKRFVYQFMGRITYSDYFYCMPATSSPFIKVDATTEIIEGQSAQIRVTNEASHIAHLYVEVDGQRVLDHDLLGNLDISIPYLSVGEHTVIIRSSDYYYYQDYEPILFSKTLKINVMEKVNDNSSEAENQSPAGEQGSGQKNSTSTGDVKKQPVQANKISLTLKTVKVKKSAKKLVLQATLKINGKLAKSKRVVFKFNGKTFKATTNSKGIAKVTITKSVLKKLKAGKKVKYQVSYGKNTVKKTAAIKK